MPRGVKVKDPVRITNFHFLLLRQMNTPGYNFAGIWGHSGSAITFPKKGTGKNALKDVP